MNRPQARRRAAGKIGPWAASEEPRDERDFHHVFLCEFYSVLHSIKTKWELKMSGIIKAKKEMVGNIGE